MQVAMPLAHDIAENARPKTDEFIENVMRPAVQDLIATLEKQADEMSKKVHCSRAELPKGNLQGGSHQVLQRA